MRSDTFNFMRDSPVNLFRYIPVFLSKDENFKSVQEALNREHEEYRLKVIDIAKQFFIETATWGVEDWEEFAGVTPKANADLEQRRAAVKAKLLGQATMTLENTNRLINAFTDKGTAYVEETSEGNKVKIVIPEQKVYLEDLRDALDEMLPAHLAYDFQRNIEIDDEEDDGVGDSVVDINDESTADTDGGAFFIHADFPIFENIPYGSWYSAPKYDGSARAAPCLAKKYDGEKIYSDFEIAAEKYGLPCKWWFAPNGESFFNKEFKNNGAIKFDGLKPQIIEYDDGMDKLSTVEVKTFLEDTFDEENFHFNGGIKFDGKIESDRGGEMSIINFIGYNGKSQFDGGDLNYFNGSIQSDGKFNFEGGGSRARIETLTDDISGKLSNSKPKKVTPPIYPEIFEYVPLVHDKVLNLLTLDALQDTVEKIFDDYPATLISKAIKYNGKSQFDGGDLNYFNGSIQADGKFNFEGGGSRAKFEILAFDLDGKFSLQKNKKIAPPNYVELFNFVPKVDEEARIKMQNNFEDSLNFDDGRGKLQILKTAIFNGGLNYGGYFESKIRRFNGGLNYRGNYRVETDGRAKFEGVELYGGRKNSSIIEFYSDLDGNFEIGSLEKIPIATKTKLGYVIIGENLEVTDGGKISLPKQKFLPIENLKNIFAKWRQKNAH